MIENIEPRLREVIRIRMGQKVPAKKKGETRPAALDTWRLTSQNREALERAADLWGGEVKAFEDPGSTDTWEVILETNVLPCVIPNVQGFSQWFELWSGGGCQRRCTGVREVIGDQACLCPEDPAERAELAGKGEACKPTTRLTVVLPDLGAYVGARLETKGYYASTELAVAEALYAAARARRTMIPAQVRLAQRTVKRPGQPPSHFVVPELLFSMSSAMDALGMAGVAKHELARATEQAALPAPDPSFGAPVPPIELPTGGESTPPAEDKRRERMVEEVIESIFAVGMRDEEGATFISLVTAGRGTSPKILTAPEEAAARKFLTQIERRQLEINFKAEGGACFVTTNGERLHMHRTGGEIVLSTDPPPPNWSELARNAGVTKAAVIRKARESATEMQLDVPSSIDDIVDEDLAAVVQTWLLEQTAERAAKAEKAVTPA